MNNNERQRSGENSDRVVDRAVKGIKIAEKALMFSADAIKNASPEDFSRKDAEYVARLIEQLNRAQQMVISENIVMSQQSQRQQKERDMRRTARLTAEAPARTRKAIRPQIEEPEESIEQVDLTDDVPNSQNSASPLSPREQTKANLQMTEQICLELGRGGKTFTVADVLSSVPEDDVESRHLNHDMIYNYVRRLAKEGHLEQIPKDPDRGQSEKVENRYRLNTSC